MVRGLNGRHRWLVAYAALFALALAMPAAAHATSHGSRPFNRRTMESS